MGKCSIKTALANAIILYILKFKQLFMIDNLDNDKIIIPPGTDFNNSISEKNQTNTELTNFFNDEEWLNNKSSLSHLNFTARVEKKGMNNISSQWDNETEQENIPLENVSHRLNGTEGDQKKTSISLGLEEDSRKQKTSEKELSPVPRDTHVLSEEQFPEKVFQDLPPRLQKPFNDKISKKQQRDLALIVLLSSLSGMLPNYFTIYDGSKISSNLFLAIVAPFGEGKGFIKFIKRILRKTHNRKLHEAELDKQRYSDELSDIEAGISCKKKSEVEPPHLYKLLMRANSSKAGLLYLLTQNKGRGIFFETEIDTLTQAVKVDFGQFSDLLRNAFQNEDYGSFRKTEKESLELEMLLLSIIISGTLGQLFTLIPKIENGLFSRFIYFSMSEDPDFHNVFDQSKFDLEEYFDDYAVFFDDVHLALEQRDDNPVFFIFQKHHQQHFREFFQDLKLELRENVTKAFGGVVHRLAVICCRIAQILSFYRTVNNTELPDQIVCEDIDFYNALEITKVLTSHTLAVYYVLPEKSDESIPDAVKDAPKEAQKIKARELHAQDLSYREISKVIFGVETKHQTVWRWINQMKS